jgi:hypothetical protein
MKSITEDRITQMFKANEDFMPDFMTEAKIFKSKETVWWTDQDGELKEVTVLSYNKKDKSYMIDYRGNEMQVEPEELEKM